VAAPLLECDEATGAAALERLAEFGLVQVVHGDRVRKRYWLHAIQRSFASECSSAADDSRIQVRYLRTLVRLAALSLHPPYRSDLADVVDAGVATNLPKAESEAAAGGAEWLDRQMRGLVAAVRVAASSIEPCIAGELALLLNGYLTAKDDRDSRLEVLTLGREASAAAGRPDLVSRLGLSLFGAGRQSGRHPKDLLPIAEQTLEQIEAGGNSSLRVAALHQIALTAYDSCDFDRAQQFARAALEAAYTGGAGAAAIFRGSVLGLLGRIRWYADTGNGEEAVALLREAAQVEDPRGDPHRPGPGG
jgi:hypothetical protein